MFTFGVNAGFTMPGTAVIGGTPPVSMSQYPHFHGEPLPYVGCFTTEDGVNGMIFLDDEADDSWASEDAANAVLLEGGNVPKWITLESMGDEAPSILEEEVEIDFTEEPKWLQGDETPDGFDFLLEIPSNISPDLNIGDGYGTAYVFADADRSGRLVWQS